MLFTVDETRTYELYQETFEILNDIYERVNYENITDDFGFLFDENENVSVFFFEIRDGLIYLHGLILMYGTQLPEHEQAIEKFNMDLRNIQIGMITKDSYWIFSSFMDAFTKYLKVVMTDLSFIRRVKYGGTSEENKLLNIINKCLNIWNEKEKITIKLNQDNSNEKINELEEKISNLNEGIRKVEYNYNQKFEKFLTDARKKVNEEVSDASKSYQLKVDNFFNTIDQDVIDKVGELRGKLNTTETELSNLGIGVKAYNSIVSEKVENEFAKYYLIKAKEEKKIYYGITITSIGLLVGSIVLAWCSLTKYYNNYVDPKGLKNTIKDLNPMEVEWVQQAAFLYLSLRLVISILIFLSVIYTGRIAYRAYLHWRHSENTHLKLASLRPFINDLSLEDIAQIRKDLIPDFFGKDAGNIDGTNESFKDLPTNVSTLAAKAIEQIGNNIGTKSNTEKNTKNQIGGTQ